MDPKNAIPKPIYLTSIVAGRRRILQYHKKIDPASNPVTGCGMQAITGTVLLFGKNILLLENISSTV